MKKFLVFAIMAMLVLTACSAPAADTGDGGG
jgi:outer membrane biogenesis lipoprotein LolB